MKPMAERKNLSVLGRRRNIFLHLSGEIFYIHVPKVQREFMWAGVMKLSEGQITSTLILLFKLPKIRSH